MIQGIAVCRRVNLQQTLFCAVFGDYHQVVFDTFGQTVPLAEIEVIENFIDPAAPGLPQLDVVGPRLGDLVELALNLPRDALCRPLKEA